MNLSCTRALNAKKLGASCVRAIISEIQNYFSMNPSCTQAQKMQ